MPIYEYEPDGHDCLMCSGRVDVIQGVNEQPLTDCPYCGLGVRRIVSNVSFQMGKGNADDAAKKGFTTFRKAETGVWEKVAGPGVDGIMSTPEDRATHDGDEATKARKVVDLDQ